MGVGSVRFRFQEIGWFSVLGSVRFGSWSSKKQIGSGQFGFSFAQCNGQGFGTNRPPHVPCFVWVGVPPLFGSLSGVSAGTDLVFYLFRSLESRFGVNRQNPVISSSQWGIAWITVEFSCTSSTIFTGSAVPFTGRLITIVNWLCPAIDFGRLRNFDLICIECELVFRPALCIYLGLWVYVPCVSVPPCDLLHRSG